MTRALGQQDAAMRAQEAVTVYDWFNLITAAANRVSSDHGRRRLQVEGGAILDRYLPVV